MMNDETEQFEQHLRCQPVKPVPAEWRAEVLAAARSALHPAPRASLLVIFNRQLATIFWLHPKAWAGLAAVWVFILTLDFSARDTAPRTVAKTAPTSPQMILALREQNKMLAELIGPVATGDVGQPKPFLARPRSNLCPRSLNA